MQPDEWMAQFQERLTALEQENTRLRTELQVCQCSLFTQARVAELERANALLQTELAEEAQQVAIDKEQEQAATERAAELAKANEALKRSLSRLAEEPDLDSFLSHVLLEVTQQVRADKGYIFLFDAATNTLELSWAITTVSIAM